MNLTFKDFNKYKSTLLKLTKSNLIADWEDILILSDLEAPIAEAQRLYGKAFNVIAFKYGKLAEEESRKTEETPTGYNTMLELEEKQVAEEAMGDSICTVDFNFKKITKETVELLFEKVEEIVTVDDKNIKTGRKVGLITASDIAVLRKLKLIKGVK